MRPTLGYQDQITLTIYTSPFMMEQEQSEEVSKAISILDSSKVVYFFCRIHTFY